MDKVKQRDPETIQHTWYYTLTCHSHLATALSFDFQAPITFSPGRWRKRVSKKKIVSCDKNTTEKSNTTTNSLSRWKILFRIKAKQFAIRFLCVTLLVYSLVCFMSLAISCVMNWVWSVYIAIEKKNNKKQNYSKIEPSRNNLKCNEFYSILFWVLCVFVCVIKNNSFEESLEHTNYSEKKLKSIFWNLNFILIWFDSFWFWEKSFRIWITQAWIFNQTKERKLKRKVWATENDVNLWVVSFLLIVLFKFFLIVILFSS